ncbi:MAG: hypothetical protein CME71_06415 [Halobacteriovorax sp.]|nr:hypothetical protein [Halobacteriovorax sp.]|tara:strand:- start:388 stop:1338 length:951 start_codon:yes stop_codon:yes gene_type:complete
MLTIQDAFHSSPIAFGGASISGEGGGYGFGGMSEVKALELVDYAFNKGLKLFDTAPIYGFGVSEVRLGKAIKSIRDDVFIISKSGIDWDNKKNVAIRNDKKTTQKMLEESLKRLGTDCIDLYMVHWPDAETDIRKTMEVLVKAQDANKIRYIGLCNTNQDELIKAAEVGRVKVVQNQLNIFERSSEELFSSLAQNKQFFMSWGTLDKGIITGRVNRNRSFDKDDVRSSDAPWWNDEVNAPKLKAMAKILPLISDHGHTGLELALSHNLSLYEQYGLIGTSLCGAKSPEQLDGILAALANPLPQDLQVEALKCVKNA